MKTVEVSIKEWVCICSELAAVKDFIEVVKKVQADEGKDDWDKGREIGRLLKVSSFTSPYLEELVVRSIGEA